MKTQIKDEKLQKALTCDYPFGCKRPLILDKYLPALGAANVELVTDSVVALSETGIISRCKDSGVEHEREVDVLIWGTGYKSSGAGMIFPAFGRGGVSLSDHVGLDVYWLYGRYLVRACAVIDKPRGMTDKKTTNIQGVAVDEFPNFLTAFGPNTVALAGSTVESIDKQALYNIQVIEYLQKVNRGSFRRAVMPRRDVTVEWVESLRPGQKKMTGSDPRCVSNYKVSLTHTLSFWSHVSFTSHSDESYRMQKASLLFILIGRTSMMRWYRSRILKITTSCCRYGQV